MAAYRLAQKENTTTSAAEEEELGMMKTAMKIVANLKFDLDTKLGNNTIKGDSRCDEKSEK